MGTTEVKPNSALEDSVPVFSGSMRIPYDLRFMDPALDWAAGFSALAGGSQKESDALRVSIAETLTFFITAYPDAETWEHLRLEFALLPGGLVEIAIANAGPPVHLSRIPLYDPQAPNESQLDGLWYFLAQGVVDDLTFTNHGFDGWRAVIQKRLGHASFAPKPATTAADARPEHTVAFATRVATPDDAAELVDVVYDTYRYTYPSEEFYYESKLRQALEKGTIFSVVVEADGVIVGNSSLILSSHTPRCAYSCSLMIKRAFRKSRAIIHLLDELDRSIASGSMDVDVCYANMVTVHTASQKAGNKIGFWPLALVPSAFPSVEFRGMKVGNMDRESGLISVRLTAPSQLPVLYLPERHHAVMAPLLTQCGLHCRLSTDVATPSETNTRFVVEQDQSVGNATLMVTQLGCDLVLRLQKRIFALRAQGIKTVIILVPAWNPIPPDLDRELGNLQAIFTGVKPISAQECYLVYTSISLPVDFERIQLNDTLAVDLKNHCARLFEELVAENAE